MCFHAIEFGHHQPSRSYIVVADLHRLSPSDYPSDRAERIDCNHAPPRAAQHHRALLDVFWYMIFATRSRLHETLYAHRRVLIFVRLLSPNNATANTISIDPRARNFQEK
jgi:hypothetical protein